MDISSSPRSMDPPPDWSSIVLTKSAGLVLKSSSPVDAHGNDPEVEVVEYCGSEVQLTE